MGYTGIGFGDSPNVNDACGGKMMMLARHLRPLGHGDRRWGPILLSIGGHRPPLGKTGPMNTRADLRDYY